MTKRIQSLKMGRYFVGLVLAASFLVTVSTHAEVKRLAEMDNLDPIFSFSFEATAGESADDYDWKRAVSNVGMFPLPGLGYGDSTVAEHFNTASVWLKNGFTGGGYADFAISLTSTDGGGDFLGFLESFQIVAGGSALNILGTIDNGANILYISGLADVLEEFGELDFVFANEFIGQYTLTFYGVKETSVPEPATLAVLGLGLAGLGLATRRRKVIAGLVLAVSLFMAVPVQAEITRLSEIENLDAIFTYSFESTGEQTYNDSKTSIKNLEGLVSKPVVVSFRNGINTQEVSLADVSAGGYTDFAISLTSTDIGGDFPGFLDSLVIKAGGTSLGITGVPNGNDPGQWIYFSGLADILQEYGEIEFIVANNYIGQYTLTFYGVKETSVPEPATLAVLGIGLAGLGLATRRRKK